MRFLTSSTRRMRRNPLFVSVNVSSSRPIRGERWMTDASQGYIRARRRAIPFVIQRGGTSKGIFFHKQDLPECPTLRDMVIQDAFGSPDVRQIDGLGGADVLTSKVAIVSKRENNTKTRTSDLNNEDNRTQDDSIVADIDYLFGQVEFGKTSGSESGKDRDSPPPTGILYDVNCGNISAGIGPFAIEEGLIEVTDDTVTPIEMHTNSGDNNKGQCFYQKVRIHNVNTGKIIVAEVPVQKVFSDDNQDDALTESYWEVAEDGDYEIDGVPGTSACIPIDFSNCTGTLGSSNHGDKNGVVSSQEHILPSGNARDTVIVDECAYDVSLLDVANFVVHIDGRQLGLTGKEASKEILNDVELWNRVRKIRYEAAKLVLQEDEITLTRPFTSVVFPYLCGEGYESIRGGDFILDEEGTKQEDEDNASIDFRAFVLFCDHPHKAYPGTASNATAAAALIEGTVVSDVMNRPIETTVGSGNKRCRGKVVTIGHPSGRMSVSSKVEERRSGIDDTDSTSELKLLRSVIGRTSRRLADGRLYLKAHTVRQLDSER